MGSQVHPRQLEKAFLDVGIYNNKNRDLALFKKDFRIEISNRFNLYLTIWILPHSIVARSCARAHRQVGRSPKRARAKKNM